MNKQITEMYGCRMKLLNIETEDELARMAGVPQATVHRIIKDKKYNPGCDSHSKILKVLGVPCPKNYPYTNLDIDIISNLLRLDIKHKEFLFATIKSLQHTS